MRRSFVCRGAGGGGGQGGKGGSDGGGGCCHTMVSLQGRGHPPSTMKARWRMCGNNSNKCGDAQIVSSLKLIILMIQFIYWILILILRWLMQKIKFCFAVIFSWQPKWINSVYGPREGHINLTSKSILVEYWLCSFLSWLALMLLDVA